jgi:crotonobetainyl-CoA:carnitine CoA-transferase CaiB-like acyl-CoA transferase
MAAPLEGIRVLEIASYVAVPAAAALLADFGAEVIKVEVPEGEVYRKATPRTSGFWGHPFPEGPPFQMDNHGKRSLALDLTHEPARAALRTLIGRSDILLTNMLPGRLRRFGLDPETLRREQPGLIYGSLSGFGSRGEDADRPAFDYAAYWASTGFMDLMHDESAPPIAQRGGIGDHAAALALVSGLLAALRTREQTGAGQVVEVSLMHMGFYILGNDVAYTLVTGETPQRHDRERAWNPIWNHYRCKDGRSIYLVMIDSDRYWPEFCRAIERPELAADEERFGNPALRYRHREVLVAILDEIFLQRSLAEWEQHFPRYRLIWSPVRTLAEAVQSAQARDAECFSTIEHPSAGKFETVRPPIRMSAHPMLGDRPAAELGADGEAVLREAGLDPAQIQAALAQPHP